MDIPLAGIIKISYHEVLLPRYLGSLIISPSRLWCQSEIPVVVDEVCDVVDVLPQPLKQCQIRSADGGIATIRARCAMVFSTDSTISEEDK